MALGLLLCVSWICFLLFDCSAGLPKDQGYRYKADLHNHDDQDDHLDSGVPNQHDWKDSGKLLVPYHTSYNMPSAAQWPGSVRSLQNQPKTKRSAEVQRLVNGRPRDWSQDDPAKELVFPLRASYPQHTPANSQPGPVDTQYPSGNTGHSSNAVGRYANANYMSADASPSAAQPGSFLSQPTNVGAQPFYPSSLGSPSGFYVGKDPNFRSLNYWQQTPVVGTQNVALNQRVSEPIRPQPLTYIVQSRNGYQRASYLQSKSRYSPQVPLQSGV